MTLTGARAKALLCFIINDTYFYMNITDSIHSCFYVHFHFFLPISDIDTPLYSIIDDLFLISPTFKLETKFGHRGQ